MTDQQSLFEHDDMPPSSGLPELQPAADRLAAIRERRAAAAAVRAAFAAARQAGLARRHATKLARNRARRRSELDGSPAATSFDGSGVAAEQAETPAPERRRSATPQPQPEEDNQP